jgi:hypothetical protein
MVKETDEDRIKRMQLQQYWLDYSLLREALRRLEAKTSAAWGREIVLPLEDSRRSMCMLRRELEALEIGFSSDE